MSEFIEFLTPSATADLEKANKQLTDMVANVDKINQKVKGFTLPSQSDSAIKELNEAYKNQEKIIVSLQKKIEDLSRAKQRTTQKTAEEIVNQQQLNKNALEYARLNSRLIGAYQKLSLEQSKSAKAVQDLIARGKTATQTQKEYDRELRNAQNEFNKLNTKVRLADSAVGKFNRNVGNYPKQALSGIKDLIGAFGIVGGATLVAGIAKDIFQTTKEIQSLDLALKQVSNSSKDFADIQAFLKDVSEDFGIEINGLTRQFTQFYVSAKDKISANEIKDIFKSVAKAAGFMGLSVDAQNRAFNALNQMMSKGTVTAEELKGQLGEALPGAFGIMAKAMGITESGLAKLMKDGNVLAADVLPKFAKALEKAYGIENKERVESLAASQTRLSNAWTDFVRSLNSGSGILSKTLIGLLDQLTKVVQAFEYLTKSQHEFQLETIKTFKTDYYQNTIKSLNAVADAHDRVTKATMLRSMARQNIKDLTEENEERQKNLKILQEEIKNNPIKAAFLKKNVFVERELKNIRMNNQVIAKNTGIIMAVNDFFEKKEIKNKEIITDLTKKKNKEKKKEIETFKEWIELLKDEEKGTKSLIDRLEYEKKKLEQEQRQLSQNNIEWRMYQKLIDGVQKSIEQLTDTNDYLADSSKNADEQFKKQIEKEKEAEKAIKALQDATDEYLKSFASDFLADAGLNSLNFFTKVQANGLTMFHELMAGASSLEEKFVIAFNGIADVVQESFAYINQASEASFNAQFERLEKEKEISLKYAGDSATAREEIERQYEERRKAIQKRQAEQQKKTAMFNIVVDTAQAIISTLAQTPPPAGIPLALLVGAIGAAQLATVASQQIPAYAEGTDNHKGGLMLINDQKGSNYVETVKTPDGKVKQYKGRNVLVNAPKGTQVLTASETMQFNNDLNAMLTNNGIIPNIKINNGMTANEMDVVLSKHFSNIQTNQTTIDKNGIQTMILKGGQKTKSLDAIVSFKGFSV